MSHPSAPTGIDKLMFEVGVAAEQRHDSREGISVTVLSPDPDIARAVAPELARRLHPSIRVGDVIHVEVIDDTSCEAVLEIKGRGFANVRVGR